MFDADPRRAAAITLDVSVPERERRRRVLRQRDPSPARVVQRVPFVDGLPDDVVEVDHVVVVVDVRELCAAQVTPQQVARV